MAHRGPGLAFVACLVIVLSACSTSTASPTATVPPAQTVVPKSLVVGLVTDIGKLNDRSFNHLSYLGIKDAAARWHIKYRIAQSRSASDYVPNLTRFAREHLNLIVAVGFSMRAAVYAVASAHPDVRFALVDAAPVDASGAVHNLPNVANLFFKEQESGYLVGVIAGLMEKQHVGKAVHGGVGYIGGEQIPQVDAYLAGYVAGAHQVDPSIRIFGDYGPGFSDTLAGGQIGLRQIGNGADILFQVAAQTGLGYLSAAQQQGVYGIGVDADQSYLGPVIITSAVKKVDVAVRLTIGSIINGTFSGGDHHYGAKEGATGFAPPSSVVPKSIVAVANQYAAKIARGTIVPPTEIPRY